GAGTGAALGFISQHPADGILGLNSNIDHTGVDLTPLGLVANHVLYNWSNHKVVQCDGWLWDPCYRTRYQNLTDMRQYPIVGHTRRTPKGKGGNLPASAE